MRVYNDTDTIITWTKYDHKNRIVRMYPPGTGSSTPDLIFTFRYDGDDNLTYKKSPDSDAEEFRYDVRNLQTARRNAILQDSGRWYATHYDVYGRPIKRGYHNSAGEPDDDLEPTIHELLEEYFYDGFNGSSTNSAAIYKGKLKKQRIKMLEDAGTNDHWTETEFFFDLYGHVVEEHITNHLDGSEVRLISFDFADNLTQESHEIEGATGVMHVSEHTYDHQGRLLADIIDLDEAGEKTTGTYAYNHKNELKELNLGRFATSGDHQYLQSLDYTYNQQGWLTGINDLLYDLIPVPPDLCGEDLPEGFAFDTLEMSGTSTDEFDMFALGLNYDQTISGSTVPVNQNGNITTQRWWHQGRPTQTYSYQYDFLDRVTRSVHGEFLGLIYSKRDHYNEDFSYDVRGNILEVSRRGLVHEPHLGESCFQPQLIDSLTYLYETGTNQLKQVIDDVPCPDFITLPPLIERDADYAANIEIRVDKTKVRCDADVVLTAGTRINILDSLLVITDCDSLPFVLVQDGACPDNKYSEGFNQQSQSGEYTYDNSGNLSYDPNKKLTFHYNHLNLPYLIKGESDELRFHYGADGALMQKTYIRNDSVIWKLDYLRGKEYRNDTLEAVYHANGRIINDTSGWSYEYWIKDHLGNVRVTFADDNGNGIINGVERRSRNDFYAFGFEHNGTWKQLESYNPENRSKYNGKELTTEMQLDHYMYGARWYDPIIGRFSNVDPLSDHFANNTTYQYALNNPIKYVDVFGLYAGEYYNQRGDYLGTDGIDDKKVYIVTDSKEAKKIKHANKSGGLTSKSELSSLVELPSIFVRSEMNNAVLRAGSPSFHEEGGYFGLNTDGTEFVVHAMPGEKSDPSIDPHASIDVFRAADISTLPNDPDAIKMGAFHTHPDGTVQTGAKDAGSNIIGGSITTHSFMNHPSDVDIDNARTNLGNVKGNRFVLAQGNKTVYIYDSQGIKAIFPFEQYFTIGLKK